ncbi:polysaccharide biosynthesis/export family protein [Polaribacter sargassicola]|uniref:polysaccharide biosynthesis/export family protein n=1 Tax=Polaribacter sargassicola TaxID=2836891 RepID=UPI001F01AE9A|nr:polysaccharide biosynthesis/export family protein [Polaribacter sp. DS7-9]MCG1036547.1 polysaccharide biosynthesis/export family protein [Polaribacter sp. DS7-9]
MIYSKLQKKFPFLIFVVSLMFFGSCVSKKKITYFQKDKIDQALVDNSYQTIFKPDDVVVINISSLDTEAVQLFNMAGTPTSVENGASAGGASSQSQQSYLVDSKGMIDFPVLGEIKLGGLTRESAIKLLKDKLDPQYVKDPTINIRIINYKISILGAVRTPGTYTIPNERISILEAIAMAGDLQISARRDNIMVQREEGNNKKIQYRVDLLSNTINTSPVFYLQQNDVIYVEQNSASMQSASSNTTTSLFITIAGFLLTMVSIIIR